MKKTDMKYGKIPGPKEWEGYKDDLDVQYAYKLFFGKSIPEVMEHFTVGGRCIERADELLFMPRKAFQYYVQAFAEHLNSERAAAEADAASPFLRLLINREKRDPGSVMEIYGKLSDTIDYVASHQSYFEAPENIYGSFQELAEQIRTAYKIYLKQNT
jgi:hypothetical protein